MESDTVVWFGNVVVADKLGVRHEAQPEYWQLFEGACALEANKFVDSVLKDKPVPLPLDTGITVMAIGRALQDALLSGEVVRFSEKGDQMSTPTGFKVRVFGD